MDENTPRVILLIIDPDHINKICNVQGIGENWLWETEFPECVNYALKIITINDIDEIVKLTDEQIDKKN